VSQQNPRNIFLQANMSLLGLFWYQKDIEREGYCLKSEKVSKIATAWAK